MSLTNFAIGQQLQAIRKHRKLSQKQVGSVIGLPHNAVSQIESGIRPLRLIEAVKVAEALRCDVSDLYSEDGKFNENLRRIAELRAELAILEGGEQA